MPSLPRIRSVRHPTILFVMLMMCYFQRVASFAALHQTLLSTYKDPHSYDRYSNGHYPSPGYYHDHQTPPPPPPPSHPHPHLHPPISERSSRSPPAFSSRLSRREETQPYSVPSRYSGSRRRSSDVSDSPPLSSSSRSEREFTSSAVRDQPARGMAISSLLSSSVTSVRR